MNPGILHADWLGMMLFAMVFVSIAGTARHPRWAREEVELVRVEHFEFDRQLIKRAAPTFCHSPMSFGPTHFRLREDWRGGLKGVQPHGSMSAASAPYRLVITAIGSSIPVTGLSTILRDSCLGCLATCSKIEKETGARSFGR